MPTDRNPVPTTPPAATTFRILVDGDAVNKDDLFDEAAPGAKPKVTLGLLLDYVFGLKALLFPGSITRAAPPIFENDPAGADTIGMFVATVTSTTLALQYFEPPHGSTLTRATVSVDPANSTPPAGVKVIAQVFKHNLLTGVNTDLGSPVTDPTTSTAYGAIHTFDTTTIAEVVDLTICSYGIRLTGETGSGAANCDWLGSTYTVTL